ncbi:chorismate mutase [Maribellus maritimus]|uniref:chorismate mutase n=1 Tax=Maribellus maritimus TaxID=2870838 RepID=UPI001EEA5021|nr:chorismate mutase [Maribellus maritimus]MCG6190985.1 chorismate mutase [Maribellus maritimus]
MKLTNPKECISAEEIRNQIDKIDKQIIELYGERHKYIEEIVRFKDDEEGIIAHDRKKQVISDRRKWAEENGLDAGTFEKMYRVLIENNIKRELELLKKKNQG